MVLEDESWNTDLNDYEFMFTHDYLAATKARSLLEDQVIQDEDNDIGDTLSEHDDDDDDDDDTDYEEIPETKATKLSPCVIVDNLNGAIGRCNSTVSLKSLVQLVGACEVELTPDESLNLTELEVCSNHFNFNHGQLHSSGTKQLRRYTKGVVNKKKCLLCNKYKTFFSRGNDCVDHCWNICGRDVQVPCLGLKSCPVFRIIPKIVSKFTIGDRYVRYICAKCFEKHGGHLHKRLGPGKSQICVENNLHTEDTNHILRLFSSWLFNLSYSQNENKKEEVLWHLIKLLETPELSSSTSMDTDFNLPSPLLVKIAMKINRFDYYSSTDKKLIKVEESRQFGEMLGNTICNSRKDIEKNRNKLENPSSLDEYYNSFPLILTSFFNGLIESIEKQKYEVRKRKNRQRGKKETEFNTDPLKKITTFLASIILTTAFRSWKIWLIYTMASLCKKPKLISSLQAILHAVHITSHTWKHETRLEKERI
ncbi:hypothetical protein C2G38_2296925, partial [Gigaspora rosea]